MKLTLDKRTLAIAVVSSLFFGSVPTDAVETDNINGIHTVYAGDHFADRFDCGFFCLGGPNWGNNGQQAWYVKVTFPESAATYSGGSCFADTVEYYDWNKVRVPLLHLETSYLHETHTFVVSLATSTAISFGGKLDADTPILTSKIAIELFGDACKIFILLRIVEGCQIVRGSNSLHIHMMLVRYLTPTKIGRYQRSSQR